MPLDSLQVGEVPAAFLSTAQAHNALAQLVATMRGQGGVRVTVSDAGIVFSFNATEASGMGLGAGSLTAGQIQVIGSDGLIRDAYTPNSNAAVNYGYPNFVKVGTGATNYSQLDNTGIFLQGGTNSLYVPFSSLTKDIALRTIQVCDNGVSKSMLVLGSLPF